MKVKIDSIFVNNENPRTITKDDFEKLKKSIVSFPEMLSIRPIVVNNDNIILGGTMRYLACQELGFKEIEIVKAENLSEDEQKEFIVKDNINFGIWDWQMLNEQYSASQLEEWGIKQSELEEIDLEKIVSQDQEDEATESETPTPIIFTYESESQLNSVVDALKKISATKEDAVFKLLKL